jgi:hypothetical protein
VHIGDEEPTFEAEEVELNFKKAVHEVEAN